jgi:hypothetical protein
MWNTPDPVRYITVDEAELIQRRLVAAGYELEGNMVNPETFSIVLDQMFANLKDELIADLDVLLFSSISGSLRYDYTRAALQVTAYAQRTAPHGTL